MKNCLNILSILTIIIFTSCEKEADIKIPAVKPKLVISAFISPQDTLIRVRVSKTVPIFRTRRLDQPDEAFDPIKEAIVSLTDGQNTVNLEYDTKEYSYTIDADLFPIYAEREYSLSVSALGQTVKGTCMVPKLVNTLNATADSVEYSTEYPGQVHSYKVLELKANWNDIFPEVNYYRFLAEVELNRPLRENDPESRFVPFHLGDENIKKDQAGTTGNFSIASHSQYPFHTPPNSPELKAVKINTYLLHVDEIYYKYYEWLKSDTEDNPFAEPTLVYTNIEGGLGVFAAYNKYIVSLDMPK